MAIVSRTRAALRIVGEDLDPEEVTRLLGVPPTAAARRGEAIRCPAGQERIAREGSWRLEAEERRPGDLDGQIAEILGRLTADDDVWRDLKSRFRVDMFCGLFVATGNQGLSIGPATSHMLGRRGITLDLDIYAETGE